MIKKNLSNSEDVMRKIVGILFLFLAVVSFAIAGPVDGQDEKASEVALMVKELLGEEGTDE